MILLSFLYFFFTSLVIFSRFRPLGSLLGAFGVLALLLGSTRALTSSLPSITTLTQGLVQPSVQLGKFADFFNLPKQ